MSKAMVSIMKWRVVPVGNGKSCLMGKVYGHHKFADGANIRTSALVSFDPVMGVAESTNTIYRLGVE